MFSIPDLFPGGSEVKASACNAGDVGLIPGLGRSPGEENGNPFQYSCLENPMDGGAWRATVRGVAKSRTRLSDFTSLHFIPGLRLQLILLTVGLDSAFLHIGFALNSFSTFAWLSGYSRQMAFSLICRGLHTVASLHLSELLPYHSLHRHHTDISLLLDSRIASFSIFTCVGTST